MAIIIIYMYYTGNKVIVKDPKTNPKKSVVQKHYEMEKQLAERRLDPKNSLKKQDQVDCIKRNRLAEDIVLESKKARIKYTGQSKNRPTLHQY